MRDGEVNWELEIIQRDEKDMHKSLRAVVPRRGARRVLRATHRRGAVVEIWPQPVRYGVDGPWAAYSVSLSPSGEDRSWFVAPFDVAARILSRERFEAIAILSVERAIDSLRGRKIGRAAFCDAVRLALASIIFEHCGANLLAPGDESSQGNDWFSAFSEEARAQGQKYVC